MTDRQRRTHQKAKVKAAYQQGMRHVSALESLRHVTVAVGPDGQVAIKSTMSKDEAYLVLSAVVDRLRPTVDENDGYAIQEAPADEPEQKTIGSIALPTPEQTAAIAALRQPLGR